MSDPQPRELVVRKEMVFAASIDRVWSAIADRDQVARWFSDELNAETLGPGAHGEFVWHSHGAFAFEVELADPPSHLVWRWAREPGQPIDRVAWTRVDWRLSPTDSGGTRLVLVESGFVDETAREQNDGGWDHELGELRRMLEG